MRQWIELALVYIMACRLLGAKPLSKPMQGYCQLDPEEQTSVKFESKYDAFHSRKCIWNCRLPKWRPWGDELIWCYLCRHWRHYDNLRCHKWWESWHQNHDDCRFLVSTLIIGNTFGQEQSKFHIKLRCEKWWHGPPVVFISLVIVHQHLVYKNSTQLTIPCSHCDKK